MTNTLYPVLGHASETVLTSWLHVFVFVSLFFGRQVLKTTFLNRLETEGGLQKTNRVQIEVWYYQMVRVQTETTNKFSLIHESGQSMTRHTILSKIF